MILNINGTGLHVLLPEQKGTGKDPSLLLIHGAGGTGEIWEGQGLFFEGKHPVFRMDLPGHGGSGLRGEERISAYGEWVRLGLRRLFGEGPFVLIGHSMGGAIVLELALNPPAGLQGIVLVGSGAKLAVTHAIFQMLKENPEAFFESIGQYAFSTAAPASLRERFVRVTRTCSPPVIYNDFKACDHFDVRSRLPEIRLPALVLCGEEDQLTPVRYSTYLHEHIASSRLVLIPHAGHMVMAEQPDALNRAIQAFLDALGV
jgi:pimeloyl-ACP methyl ester carboxylesterase